MSNYICVVCGRFCQHVANNIQQKQQQDNNNIQQKQQKYKKLQQDSLGNKQLYILWVVMNEVVRVQYFCLGFSFKYGDLIRKVVCVCARLDVSVQFGRCQLMYIRLNLFRDGARAKLVGVIKENYHF
eukprot:TRINITY_DN5547_c0_g1_i9.p3 TRINITY_DN5547_c0_g1~~TRINITY_DN5547_c0_g1_i9.p3  ORF type:complete len:127 (-),score=4.42 TRINITY_DN5547_c0_g1_i9:63-443(-)